VIGRLFAHGGTDGLGILRHAPVRTARRDARGHDRHPAATFDPVRQLREQLRHMAEGTVAADQLRLFIERIERLEEEKKGTADDIKDVYAEAKANGYDSKIMRQIVRLRKMEAHARQEADALLETYRQALGLE
jgi:uncharacterized protein (UPF0335 family)